MSPEDLFLALARREPYILAQLIASGMLTDMALTFAAECMGQADDGGLILQVLVPLLQHASPVVREGAIYGLLELSSSEASAAIQAAAVNDASPGVRRAAARAGVTNSIGE